jgi:hypothetical protein
MLSTSVVLSDFNHGISLYMAAMAVDGASPLLGTRLLSMKTPLAKVWRRLIVHFPYSFSFLYGGLGSRRNWGGLERWLRP